ncbi:MAG: hypothetical protein IT210_09250 [Armatimonadetes bacterium]|nr:hypothetical protein [Armatimonadota bacterium]
MIEKINLFLDRFVLPWPVKFLTHRFVILATILMLVPLIAWKVNQVFVLAVNSYLNTMSVAVSSIVLLYATISEIRDRKIAEAQEKRAQEDHTHVVEMHQLVLDTMRAQHEEIEDLREILAHIQGRPYERRSGSSRLAVDLRALHPRGQDRFSRHDYRERLKGHTPGALHRHPEEAADRPDEADSASL